MRAFKALYQRFRYNSKGDARTIRLADKLVRLNLRKIAKMDKLRIDIADETNITGLASDGSKRTLKFSMHVVDGQPYVRAERFNPGSVVEDGYSYVTGGKKVVHKGFVAGKGSARYGFEPGEEIIERLVEHQGRSTGQRTANRPDGTHELDFTPTKQGNRDLKATTVTNHGDIPFEIR